MSADVRKNGLSAIAAQTTRSKFLRLLLTVYCRRQRLQWCRGRRHWSAKWELIFFSDESRFNLMDKVRRILACRYRGERHLESGGRHGIDIVQRYIGPGLTPSVLAWGAIAFHALSHLLRIAGTMTSRHFITNVLAAKLLPFLQAIPGAVFQQDNARPYITPDVQHVLYAHHVFPGLRTRRICRQSKTCYDRATIGSARQTHGLWMCIETQWRNSADRHPKSLSANALLFTVRPRL